MNIESITNALKNVKPGTFTRLVYKSEMPVKAEFKKMGYKVVKITSTTTRFGIHYGNIKEVKENASNDKYFKVNEALKWIVKDIIQYNSNTEKYYLCTYPTIKGRNSSTKYDIYLNGERVMEGIDIIDRNMIINSYWSGKSSKTNMMKINVDNIIKIGG